MKAIYKGVTIAESNDTIVFEGSHYFPPDSIKKVYFQGSNTRRICPWKGEARYYDIATNGELNKDLAWYYPEPKEAAKKIKNYVAFWKGVEVVT